MKVIKILSQVQSAAKPVPMVRLRDEYKASRKFPKKVKVHRLF